MFERLWGITKVHQGQSIEQIKGDWKPARSLQPHMFLEGDKIPALVMTFDRDTFGERRLAPESPKQVLLCLRLNDRSVMPSHFIYPEERDKKFVPIDGNDWVERHPSIDATLVAQRHVIVDPYSFKIVCNPGDYLCYSRDRKLFFKQSAQEFRENYTFELLTQ